MPEGGSRATAQFEEADSYQGMASAVPRRPQSTPALAAAAMTAKTHCHNFGNWFQVTELT
jgi:hypothetical protein